MTIASEIKETPPEKGAMPHGMLKGFGVSMLITVVHGIVVFDFLFITTVWANDATMVILSYIPVFLLVNIGIAHHYETQHHYSVDNYYDGMVLMVPLALMLIIFIFFLIIIANGFAATAAGGQ